MSAENQTEQKSKVNRRAFGAFRTVCTKCCLPKPTTDFSRGDAFCKECRRETRRGLKSRQRSRKRRKAAMAIMDSVVDGKSAPSGIFVSQFGGKTERFVAGFVEALEHARHKHSGSKTSLKMHMQMLRLFAKAHGVQ